MQLPVRRRDAARPQNPAGLGQIDRDRVGASVDNGVLTIRAPKTAAARRPRITVQVA